MNFLLTVLPYMEEITYQFKEVDLEERVSTAFSGKSCISEAFDKIYQETFLTKKMKNIKSLRNVHFLLLEEFTGIVDVSVVQEVNALVLRNCSGIMDVRSLVTV